MVSFQSNPKERQCQKCSNYHTTALIRHAGKVMSLLLNMLSRLVITFLPRSKCVLISWLQSPSAEILEPKKIKSVKWALRSISRNRASGGDGITVELFQILEDDPVKVLHSICQQIWKTQQWPEDWKRSISFHFNPKERQCQRMFKQTHNCTHLTC